jgi:hypothetical protein
MTEHETNSKEVSVDTDSLDTMIQEASTPSLASLFRLAKNRGLLGPVTVYGEAPPA